MLGVVGGFLVFPKVKVRHPEIAQGPGFTSLIAKVSSGSETNAVGGDHVDPSVCAS